MDKAVAILVCIATFAIILMFAIARADEIAALDDAVFRIPAMHCAVAL